MEINTNTLGPIEIDENRIINFLAPLPGIEQGGTHYALLDMNPQSQVKLLQSVDNAHICFLVGDPAKLAKNYTVDLSPDDLAGLNLQEGGEAAVLVILTAFGDSSGMTTANLKAPIVINRKSLKASQVILHAQDYSTKAPVSISKS